MSQNTAVIATPNGYPFGKISFTVSFVQTECPFSLLPGGDECREREKKNPPRRERRFCPHRTGNKR